ncbi:triose-phosphate isomerase family protein [Lactococcus fujiensis]|uniref:triose-phosphate isomerase family protein n=1 Tax=Lactococcus fujiensis TaxID=610251 RepID=UPI000AC44289
MSSRKPIIAGNWKLNKNLKETLAFLAEIDGKLPSEDKVEVAIAAPAMYLIPLVHHRGNNPLKVSAEMFTSKIQVRSQVKHHLKHSQTKELNILLLVTQNVANISTKQMKTSIKKAHALFAAGVTPILCCGETLETFEAGKTAEWVSGQIEAGLKGLTAEQVSSMVIAYEPIWAIGTGKTATAEIADETCGVVRSVVEKLYGKNVSEAVRIQYGGSVKPETVEELMSKENIDGALVGGASLQAASFLGLLDIYK